MIETIGPHRAKSGSPAAILLAAAEVEMDKRAAANERNDDHAETIAAMKATSLLRNAKSAIGYVGLAVEPEIVATSHRVASEHGFTEEGREYLVGVAMQFGCDESVARRSVIGGMLRGANPPRETLPPVAKPTKRTEWPESAPSDVA